MNLLVTAPDWMVWLLIALLAAAAIQDAAQLKISNAITLLVAVLALIAMVLTGLRMSMWQNLLVFALVLGVGMLLFARRILGGGDVKLFAAIALWTDFGASLGLIAAIFICGGVLAILILVLRSFAPIRMTARLKTLQRRAGIPYGVAIAAGAMLIVFAWPSSAPAPLPTL